MANKKRKGESTNFGSFLSVFDKNNEISGSINHPKFKSHINILHKNDLKSTSISFSMPKLEDMSEEGYKITKKTEFSVVWIQVTLPFQIVSDKNGKISYNKYVSTLDLIKNIEITNGKNVKKSMSKNDYKLELESLGKSKFDILNKKYFQALSNLSVPVRDFKVKNQVVVNQTTIFYPIFFKPYLKTYLVKNEFFKISVSFNNIESLFTLSSSESPKSLKEIDLNEIKVIGIYEEINNSNVFDKFQQTENKKIEHELFFETYTNNKKTMNSTDHFHFEKQFVVQKMFSSINDQTFRMFYEFYANNINDSVLVYLNSCIKAEDDNTEKLLNLSTQKMTKETSQIEVVTISDNRLQIVFDSMYKTIIKLNGCKFSDLKGIYFDLKVSNVLNLYWFDYIEIDFELFDEYEHVIGTGFDTLNGERIENHLFKSDKIVVKGASKYKFNYSITKSDYLDSYQKKELDNLYLTDKHFDIYFSLPVSSNRPSKYAQFYFVRFDYLDWEWMDLDKKYRWNASCINFKLKSDTNYLKSYSGHVLNIISNSSDENKQTLSFENSLFESDINKNIGFFDLEGSTVEIEYSIDEFSSIKSNYYELIIKNLSFSKIKFFEYITKSQTYEQIESMKTLENICKSNSFLCLVDTLTNNPSKKCKLF
jgi:hypothetical protein